LGKAEKLKLGKLKFGKAEKLKLPLIRNCFSSFIFPAPQPSSLPAFQPSSFSAFQLFSISVFQPFSFSQCVFLKK